MTESVQGLAKEGAGRGVAQKAKSGGIDEGAMAAGIDAVNALGGGFENEANTFFFFDGAALRFAALVDSRAKQERGEGKEEHKELQVAKFLEPLWDYIHDGDQADIQKEKSDDGALEGVTNSNPDDGKEEEVEETGAAMGVPAKHEKKGKKDGDNERESLHKIFAAEGSQEIRRGGRQKIRADSQETTQRRHKEFEEKGGDTGESHGVADAPIEGRAQVVVRINLASVEENRRAEASRKEGGDQRIAKEIEHIAHGVQAQVAVHAIGDVTRGEEINKGNRQIHKEKFRSGRGYVVVEKACEEARRNDGRESGYSDAEKQGEGQADRRVPGADAMPELKRDGAAVQEEVSDQCGKRKTEPAPDENGTRKSGVRKESGKNPEEKRGVRFKLEQYVRNVVRGRGVRRAGAGIIRGRLLVASHERIL